MAGGEASAFERDDQKRERMIQSKSYLELLDIDSHTTLRNSSTTKDLNRIIRNLCSAAGEVVLEQADGTGEKLGLSVVGHGRHLEGDVLQPRLSSVDLRQHGGKSEERKDENEMARDQVNKLLLCIEEKSKG